MIEGIGQILGHHSQGQVLSQDQKIAALKRSALKSKQQPHRELAEYLGQRCQGPEIIPGTQDPGASKGGPGQGSHSQVRELDPDQNKQDGQTSDRRHARGMQARFLLSPRPAPAQPTQTPSQSREHATQQQGHQSDSGQLRPGIHRVPSPYNPRRSM